MAGDWKGIEEALTSLQFVENKCRCVDPYHLLTDYSAVLDATHFVAPASEDGVPHLSYLQRIRLMDFQRFVKTYAIIFKIHPELVIQQAANMPDDSAITRETCVPRGVALQGLLRLSFPFLSLLTYARIACVQSEGKVTEADLTCCRLSL
jgi:hypothetical protein